MLLHISCRKFRPLCSSKLLILYIVIVWLLNLLLFYHLKFLTHKQNTVHVLQNPKVFLGDRTKITENVMQNDRNDCKIGNFTIQISQKILLQKENLSNFYYVRPDFSQLSEMCNKFIQKVITHPEISSLKVNGEINFIDGNLINNLKTAKVFKVQNAPKGSQLKLLAVMENNLRAIIKPKWYSPFDIISGTVYAGKDRHYGEILAFYLSVLLNMPRVPPAVSRKFDIHKEIISVADERLLNTFLTKDNQTCFYGVCPYCNPSELLCLDSTILEGAVIYYLSSRMKLRIFRHPWKRTYRCNTLARWETEENYCVTVQNSQFYSRDRNVELFLDLIDTSIFDFLIDNGDRHHYEFVDSLEKPRILLLDNGKSFGNPYTDHIDILAPLYHCCLLRNSTWNSLLQLRGGNLSNWLQYLLSNSDNIFINAMHLKALDRRLILIFSTVEYCFVKKGSENVIIV